ncbi:MAG TPA: SPOR domain-containing protein [Sphingomicrobium sp.]|nr:SPOR domain-containing protein [Sphingomicrobium sp.]
MSPKHLVTAAMAAFLSVPVSAQSVKAGIEAWQRADYTSAVAIWRPFAEKGDADAEFNLGQAYRLGRGVPLDLGAAKMWFWRAANSGHLDAETTLGLLLFQNGDQVNGLKWLKRAADQGEPRALLVYGTALYNGDGVPRDHLLGYAYVSRAAAQGLAPAKDTLEQLDSLMPESDRKKALLLARAAPSKAPPPARTENPLDHASSKAAQAKPAQAKKLAARPVKSKTPVHPLPAKVTSSVNGNWRIQLGAFAQHSSAEALYRRIAGKRALAGRNAFYIATGPLTRLQVGPFESRAAAAAACGSLGAACFPVPSK